MIDIKVIPNSGKNFLKSDKGGTIVCYLKSTPERGLANRELITYLAARLKLPQQRIHIVSGLTSRKKRLRIEISLSKEELFSALALEKQMCIY